MNALPGLVPYARPYFEEDEIRAVTDVLRSGTWTNGPIVERLEKAFSAFTGAAHSVAVSSGTMGLFAILQRLAKVGRKLFITSSLNFTAGASCARLLGFDVAFTDVDENTLNMSADSLKRLLSRLGPRYDAIIVSMVWYAGCAEGCGELIQICRERGVDVVEDACHAVGAHYVDDGRPVGSHNLTAAAVFSFHPNKPVAAGEGGMVTTNDGVLAQELRLFRNHNMMRSCPSEPWHYHVDAPGLNLRLSEMHAAIALVQLGRLRASLVARQRMADRYLRSFAGLACLRLVGGADVRLSALHLFAVVFDLMRLQMTRRELFAHFAAYGVALQVHYVPLHSQRAFSGFAPEDGQFSTLERLTPGLVSLPLFLGLQSHEQQQVIEAVHALERELAK